MKKMDERRRSVVFDGFFKIVEAEVSYERPSGDMSEPVRRLVFERGDSVAAVIVDAERRMVLLTRQFRYPAAGTGDGWPLEVVAGSIEPGETPEECMRRELEEELGYAVPTLRLISTFYVSPGGSSERIHLFYAEVRSSQRVSAGGGTLGEDIETVEIPLHAIPRVLARGEIVDAKTLIGLTWLVGERGRSVPVKRHGGKP